MRYCTTRYGTDEILGGNAWPPVELLVIPLADLELQLGDRRLIIRKEVNLGDKVYIKYDSHGRLTE
jgi:hypothetical protein